MNIPFFTLTSLVALIPAFGTTDKHFAVGAFSAILALALAAAAIEMSDADIDRFRRLMRSVLIAVLAAPAFCMALQILPMPMPEFANSIWSNASGALDQKFPGAITIDVGETVFALAQYFSFVGAAVLTVVITLDRQRAEVIFYILMMIMTLIAAWQVINDLGWLPGNSANTDQAVLLSLAGVILSCSAALNLYSRLGHKLRQQKHALARSAIAGTALTVCGALIFTRGDIGTVIACMIGICAVVAIFVIRQWTLGPWGKAGVAATAAIALVGALSMIPSLQYGNHAVASPLPGQTPAERMLVDVPFAGYGAGTYDSLWPIYGDTAPTAARLPTGAEVIAIEMGHGFFDAFIVVILLCASILFGCALARRQDYVFASAGAAFLMAGPVLFFFNGGMFGPGAALLLGVFGGLALAQSQSAQLRKERSVPSLPFDPTLGEILRPDWRARRKVRPRLLFALLALVLAVQAVWLLATEIYANGRSGSTQPSISSEAALERIQKAAEIAVVRGDLWAQSAWAQLAPHEIESGMEIRLGQAAVTAWRQLNRAVRYAPHRSDVWLMLALLAERYNSVGIDVGALVKMAYYTAPNDFGLLRERLYIAIRVKSAEEDSELQDLIRRDIDTVIHRQPALRPSLVAAYKSASPAQRRVAERLINEVDPDYLESIRQR